MRLPPVLSTPNETKPFPSPSKCSGISRFYNDRHKHVWCLGFFSWRPQSAIFSTITQPRRARISCQNWFSSPNSEPEKPNPTIKNGPLGAFIRFRDDTQNTPLAVNGDVSMPFQSTLYRRMVHLGERSLAVPSLHPVLLGGSSPNGRF
ncbi:hypothetical protein AVEN_19856-1 [Araneus ventricosus]|uniref:Uncharacterized protein n=1 Tax=Araneus ventricosus TaxID=182803 RepID=A0A4Y2E1K0_ARAVE|nr:hypothetical protein AVEN_19856-1 [Araneus ventricosus]